MYRTPTAEDQEVMREKVRVASAHLKEHGWAVITDVIPEGQATAIYNDLWRTLEAVSRGRVLRTDPRTWKGDNFFKAMKGILMEPSAIYHCEAAWAARKATVDYFAYLYGQSHLASSFDRINIFPAPAAVGGKVQKVGPWLHTDQNMRPGLMCVQGFLDLFGTGPSDAGLIVADKSHLQHQQLMVERWGLRNMKNWHKFTDEQRAYITANFEMTKVLCPPRSLVLWDSRTFHQNTPPLAAGHERCVFYTCFQPWELAGSAKNIANAKTRKILAFTNKRGTSHWPLPSTLFSEYARSYGQPRADYDLSDQAIRRPNPYDPANASILAMIGGLDGPSTSATFIQAAIGHPLVEIDKEVFNMTRAKLIARLPEAPRAAAEGNADDEEEEEDSPSDDEGETEDYTHGRPHLRRSHSGGDTRTDRTKRPRKE